VRSSLSISAYALERLSKCRTAEEWLSEAARELINAAQPSRLVLAIRNKQGRYHPAPLEWCAPGVRNSSAANLRPLLRRTVEQGDERVSYSRNGENSDEAIERLMPGLEHERLEAATASLDGGETVTAILFDCAVPDLSADQIHPMLSALARLYVLTVAASVPQVSQAVAARYERLVEHSDAILFNTDLDQGIVFISRRALDFFGMAPEEFATERRLKWTDLIHPEDAARVRTQLNRQRGNPQPFDDEVRVINRVTGRVRWLLMRLVPVLNRSDKLAGWDGFGIDISSRRDAQDALDVQSRKIRALYTVSSAIRGYLDPANIAIRGLAALCDATGAHAGVCFLYPPRSNPQRGEEEWENIEPEQVALQPIARYGFPSTLTDEDPLLLSISTFAAYVAQSTQSLVVPDLCSDPRSGVALATQEELRAAVLVPIAVEDEVLGAVGLFSREPSRFDGSSVMLVSAAANQIGLAARQANLFSLYRRQTKHLAALYRMSHELSRHLELEPLFQNAFSIIRDELGLKRLWLGLLSESGSRLTGQAAYGPGWRRRLIDVSVDVTKSDHVLGRVVWTKRPVMIQRSDELLREFGVKRLFNRMSIHAVALVPIMAGGQVIGVLAVQPGVNEPNFQREQLHLLVSLASEIGVNVQTQRLYTRTQEGEKMRASSVLAAGIAHNFNNSLQAILGQASLLEMQKNSPERVQRASRMITDAATKSAGLVRQLLAFTQLEEPRKELVDVGEFLERSREMFTRQLTSKNTLHFDLSAELEPTFLDPNQLMRVMTAILQNAAESMPNGGDVFVATDTVELGEDRTTVEVPPGRYVRLRVRDTGLGMSEETKRRCFEPFFTTKNVDAASGLGLSGAGLGLAAAYTLIRRNNGRILVESQLGAGTTFLMFLPVASEMERSKTTTRSLKPEKIRIGAKERESERVPAETPEGSEHVPEQTEQESNAEPATGKSATGKDGKGRPRSTVIGETQGNA